MPARKPVGGPTLQLVERLEDRILFAAPTQWSSRGIGGGGAFFAPSFSPHNAAEVYVSSDMSGLYRSTDTGASWWIRDFREVQANRGSQVQFTSDPNVLYTLDYTEDFSTPTQVTPSKSTDGGVNWTQLSSWDTQVGEDAYFLAADPNVTTRLIANDYGHLYVSNDGGQNWASRYTAPDQGQGLHVGGAFFDGQNVYVGTSAGLLVSTNGGASFTPSNVGGIPAGQTIFSLAGAKQNGVTRLTCVTVPTGDVYNGVLVEVLGTSFSGVYSLDVGQASWTNRTAGIPTGEYLHHVSMARNDINTAYLAGTDSTSSLAVFKTTTGGTSWSDVFRTLNNQNVATGWQGHGGDRGWSFGETAMAFQVAPNDPNKLAFTDFGYVHLSTDGGATWRQAYVNPADQHPAGSPTPQRKAYRGVGLEDTSALWLQWTDPNNVVVGYTDIRGARSTDGGSSWAFPANIDLAQNTIYQISARSNPTGATPWTLYAAASGTHDIYQSTYVRDADLDGGSGRVLVSTNQGASWATLHDFGNPVVYTALDPTNPERMYASVVDSTQGGIFVTNNLSAGAASTWTKVTNPPRTQGHPYNIKVLNDGTLVVSYSARRTAANFFTASAGVFVSTDQGNTWADRTLSGGSGSPGMQYWTKDITIDPTDPLQNTWWAAVRSGFGPEAASRGKGGLYRTTDRGLTWTRVFGSTFAVEGVESCTINPATHEMYVSTLDRGLWYSTNFDAATPTFTQTSYPFRQPERVFINPNDANEVWVASFGYGLAVGRSDAAVPAVVQSVQVNDGNAQRSMVKSVTVTFDRAVVPDAGAFTLAGRNGAGAGTVVSWSSPVANPSGAANFWVLTFTGAPVVGGSLADGVYDLTVVGSNVHTGAATGPAMAGNHAAEFHRLYGDGDGDGDSDNADLFAVRATYNKPPADPAFRWYFDYEDDKDVDNADLFQVRNRRGLEFKGY